MEMRKGGSLLNLFCDLFFSPSRKHGFLAALTNKRNSEMYGTKSRGLRTWKLTGPSSGAENSHLHGIHAFQCPDKVGIMAKITECFASRGANILSGDVYVSLHGRQGRNPVFYSRSEFIYDPMQWPRALIDEDFLRLSEIFNAQISAVRIPDLDPPLKVALLVSWQDHCLVDLLYRWQERELPVYITCVISNHMREPNTHVIRFLERHGIPYHFIPANKENKREEEILNLISDTDFLVLARYMQVLSPAFLKIYGKDIINIHHGLLPSFKGANPYKQAYEAGVKLIGATSHFVTEELDDGPIIEQMVDRVSHRDTLKAFAMKSENLERQCLAKAVKSYCELRIMRYSGNKTIIFD